MDSIRITQLPTKSAAGTDDYIAVDSTANGTKKIQFPNLLDDGLTIQNKAADARATGDAINNEASTRQFADANLQTQIDQLIAPSGEAPSAAEIENARIGAPPESIVYPTLGDAIRGQVSDLKSTLNNETLFTSVEYNPFNTSNWSVGHISPTTGNNASSSQTIRLNAGDFINPQNGATYLKAEVGYSFHVYAYEQNGTYVGAWDGKAFSKTWSYIPVTEFKLLSHPNYKYRVSMGRDGEAMSTSEYINLVIYYIRTASDGYRGKMLRDNLAEDTTKTWGYLSSSGTISGASDQSGRETTTDFIPIVGDETYTFTLYVNKSVDYWSRICFYNASKEYITRYDDSSSTPLEQWGNFNVKTFQGKAPSNASFVRVSQRYGFCIVTKGVTSWEYMPSSIDIRKHWNLRPKQDYFVKSINHRGYGRVAPENTKPAFELSADLGFWGVETDIRFTSDGVAVLLHDETINRTARNADGTEISGTINIADITYAQALTYDFGIWMGSQYAGTRIMTFEEFISLCRKKSLHAYNEIKAGTDAQVAELVQTTKRYGMEKHSSWTSFSASYLSAVCNYDADARIGLLSASVDDNYIGTLLSLKTATNTVFANVDGSTNSSLTNTIIDSLISNDIALEMYTPNFVSVVESKNPYVTGMTSDWCIAGDVLYTGRNNIMIF
jgi:glycerophosphoryl diester phosphodiesterase